MLRRDSESDTESWLRPYIWEESPIDSNVKGDVEDDIDKGNDQSIEEGIKEPITTGDGKSIEDGMGQDIKEDSKQQTYLQVRIVMMTNKDPEMPYLTIFGPERRVFTLILKRTNENADEYRRIGRGEVRDGSDSAWPFRTLTII
jgi:hypothetical protein